MRALLLLLSLAACVQYPDDCNRRALQELRTVDRLIQETGYRTGFVLCTGGYPYNFCTGNDMGYTRRAVAIDPEAERRKLDSLTTRREALATATASCVAG